MYIFVSGILSTEASLHIYATVAINRVYINSFYLLLMVRNECVTVHAASVTA